MFCIEGRNSLIKDSQQKLYRDISGGICKTYIGISAGESAKTIQRYQWGNLQNLYRDISRGICKNYRMMSVGESVKTYIGISARESVKTIEGFQRGILKL